MVDDRGPRYLWFLMTFKKGTKGQQLLLLLLADVNRQKANDHDRNASVRMMRMAFL